jgi:hypothetical protein
LSRFLIPEDRLSFVHIERELMKKVRLLLTVVIASLAMAATACTSPTGPDHTIGSGNHTIGSGNHTIGSGN